MSLKQEKEKKGMSFDEALKILGIEKYSNRIFNSNSHGELFHLADYIFMAEGLQKQTKVTKEQVAAEFDRIVAEAEATWSRPESVFQHMSKIFGGS